MTNLIDLINDIFSFKSKTYYFQDNQQPKEYKLSFDLDEIDEVKLPEEVIPPKREPIDLTDQNNKIKRSIESFIQIVEKNFSKEDLRLYHRNINDLTIKKGLSLRNALVLFLYPGILGSYDSKKNEIIYNPLVNSNQIEIGVFHELFHMASTYKDDKKIYVGFSQLNLTTNKSIGNGINEGYTEYLAQKYYPNEVKRCSYPYEIQIINIIKSIIGEEKMTSLYLNGNLKGLIYELSKYSPISNIIEFLINLDFITKNQYVFNGGETLKKVDARKVQVERFLANLYINSKEDELINSRLIDEYEEISRKGPKGTYISPQEPEYLLDLNELSLAIEQRKIKRKNR